MLKISEDRSRPQAITFRLEGRVVGPWVDELGNICEQLLADDVRLTLDLAEVSFADEMGVQLLTRLHQRGVKFSKASPFVTEQLEANNRVTNIF